MPSTRTKECVVDYQPSCAPAMKSKLVDYVLTGNGRLEKVDGFLDRHEQMQAGTEDQERRGESSFELTRNHLVYVLGHEKPVLAKDIKIGDKLPFPTIPCNGQRTYLL